MTRPAISTRDAIPGRSVSGSRASVSSRSRFNPNDYSLDDVTAANFPAIRHFFPCVPVAGTYALPDVIGGVRLPVHGI